MISYPALREKVDTGGPVGGAGMLRAEAGGGLMEETRGVKAGTVEGMLPGRVGRDELPVKEEVSVEAIEKWELASRGLLKGGRAGTEDGAVDAEMLLIETELVPGTDRGLDNPEHRENFKSNQVYLFARFLRQT